MTDLNDSQARTSPRIQPHTPMPPPMPQRAHLVDVGDLILLQTPEVRARFGGVDRLTIDRVHGRWAWAGDYGFTPQTLRAWLDAGIVTLACVPPLLPPTQGDESTQGAQGAQGETRENLLRMLAEFLDAYPQATVADVMAEFDLTFAEIRELFAELKREIEFRWHSI